MTTCGRPTSWGNHLGTACGMLSYAPHCRTDRAGEDFPQLLPRGSLNAREAMIESSRFWVDTTLASDRAVGLLQETTLFLFAGIIEWSMVDGYSEVVTATDLRFERILKRAGWPMQRLGEPIRIGIITAIAGKLTIDAASFRYVCPLTIISGWSASSRRRWATSSVSLSTTRPSSRSCSIPTASCSSNGSARESPKWDPRHPGVTNGHVTVASQP